MLKKEHRLTETGVSGTRLYPSAAAKLLGRKPETILRWVRNGLLTKRVDSSGRIQVLEAEVTAIASKLPQAGRRAADLSALPSKEGWLTLCEVAQTYSDKGSYATWYNWAKNGQLKTEGTGPKLTKRLWILRCLQSMDKLDEQEQAELMKLERAHLKDVAARSKKGKRNANE